MCIQSPLEIISIFRISLRKDIRINKCTIEWTNEHSNPVRVSHLKQRPCFLLKIRKTVCGLKKRCKNVRPGVRVTAYGIKERTVHKCQRSPFFGPGVPWPKESCFNSRYIRMRPKMRRGVFNWISRGSTRGTALTATERSIGLDNFGAGRTERALTRLVKNFLNFL